VNNFQHHVSQLEALGFQLERGMLVGAGEFPAARQIGVRFSSSNTQVDTYLLDEFFNASKSHPVLGELQIIDGPDGKYTVTAILAN
jgi:hypothetical protein